ncbi:hypothetical protein Moror_1552 [Moniliophthora roreri MCA 2997]|uniref:Uncharacterized protein n=1 Tax=Moniliophthora roreri (strain MCA 2997) TaxID=1381753 RepID=V2XL10_MONRO|nr:hypothetical protein Moror_1552 [Moniliophthora roreri MCA 2997]
MHNLWQLLSPNLLNPYSLTPHMSLWWAAAFFHCGREMCGVAAEQVATLFPWNRASFNKNLDDDLAQIATPSTMKGDIAIEEFKRTFYADRYRLLSEGNVFEILRRKQAELEKKMKNET